MIQIKQTNNCWRLKLIEEEWEFSNKADFEKELKYLIDLKDKHKLNDFKAERRKIWDF